MQYWRTREEITEEWEWKGSPVSNAKGRRLEVNDRLEVKDLRRGRVVGRDLRWKVRQDWWRQNGDIGDSLVRAYRRQLGFSVLALFGFWYFGSWNKRGKGRNERGKVKQRGFILTSLKTNSFPSPIPTLSSQKVWFLCF